MFGCGQTSSPPLSHISVFDLNVVAVHPVNKLLVGVQVLQDLVLFSTVVSLDLALGDTFLGDELCFVGETGKDYFIASEMHQGIGEDVEYLGEYLFDQFVGLGQSYIQASHKPGPESAGDSLVFGRQTPTGSMAGGI